MWHYIGMANHEPYLYSKLYNYILLIAKNLQKSICLICPYLQLHDCNSKLSVPMYIVVLIYMLDYIYIPRLLYSR